MEQKGMTFKQAAKRWKKLTHKQAAAKIAKRIAKQFRLDFWGIHWYGGNTGDPPRKAHDEVMFYWTNAFKDRFRERYKNPQYVPGLPVRIVTGALLRSYWGGEGATGSPWEFEDYQQGDQGYVSVKKRQTDSMGTATMSFGSRLFYAYDLEFGGEEVSYAHFFPAVNDIEPIWRRRIPSIMYDHVMFALNPLYQVPVTPEEVVAGAYDSLPPEAYDEDPFGPADPF